MLQAIVKKGKTTAEEIPAPLITKGCVLIQVSFSAISVGTEIGKVQRTGKSLLKTALEQPDKVREAVDMINSKGLSKTLSKVKDITEAGKLTGYSLSGVVLTVGDGVKNFQVGDRVAAAGADLANHAEYVNVPKNLVMKIPDGLDLKYASTVTLGGIAFQGVRRANLKLGEFAVVFGAGILGLITIQLLKAAGVRVAAVDLDDRRLSIAKEYGSEIIINPNNDNFINSIENWTAGLGCDAVLFTAATSKSEPLSSCFKVTRKKGRVILIGVSGMEINREDIYAKELDFLISSSYGPGRYDADYEEKGIDYPYAFVRWTENRNMSEYLRLLSNGNISLDKMIDGTYKITDVQEAFDFIKSDKKPILVLLEYPSSGVNQYQDYRERESTVFLNTRPPKANNDIINIALVGAGNFATGTHLPNLIKLKNKYRLHAVMNRSGHKAKAVANRYSAQVATTDFKQILNDETVDLVFITTRHDSHASLTLEALKKNKHVFVEKPLAINNGDLKKIEAFYKTPGSKPILMVGYNRRFSPYAQEIKKHTVKRQSPLFIHYRMNAGYLPKEHWVFNQGGRIIGEGCHIIDLMSFFTESRIKSFNYKNLMPGESKYSGPDNISLILSYDDGSVATIEYFAVGSKKLSKEYMEIHFDGKTIIMDDYKSLKGYGVKIKEIKSRIPEKGLSEELLALYNSLSRKDEKWPIELWDLLQTTKTTSSIT